MKEEKDRITILTEKYGDELKEKLLDPVFFVEEIIHGEDPNSLREFLNAIETQFRNSLKELGMSRKEKKKGFVEKANKDFSSIFADKEVIEVKQDAEGNKSIKATK